MPLQIDPIVARHVGKYLEEDSARTPINSHSAKGFHVIGWKDRQPWYWFDKKTAGYPQVNFIDSYVLRGGNWTKIEDKSPEDVYRREVAGEETAQTPVGRVVCEAVLKHSFPFADFLEITPLEVHGNVAMMRNFPYSKGTIIGMTSVFGTEIDGDELLAEIRRSNPSFELAPESLTTELKRISKESDVCIITSEQCTTGETPRGAFGEDQKLAMFLKERGYVRNPQVQILPGVENHMLSSSPMKPFAERGEVPLYRVKPTQGAQRVRDEKLFG